MPLDRWIFKVKAKDLSRSSVRRHSAYSLPGSFSVSGAAKYHNSNNALLSGFYVYVLEQGDTRTMIGRHNNLSLFHWHINIQFLGDGTCIRRSALISTF